MSLNRNSPIVRVGIGQDSHRFLPEGSKKKCIIAGVHFPLEAGMDADSDGDVVFHAICNALDSLTGACILGDVAIRLCHNEGIVDSIIYLKEAQNSLSGQRITHVALTIEGARPRMQKMVPIMRASVAKALNIIEAQVGITVTSGDTLTAFGRGEGLQCFCILTTTEYPL